MHNVAANECDGGAPTASRECAGHPLSVHDVRPEAGQASTKSLIPLRMLPSFATIISRGMRRRSHPVRQLLHSLPMVQESKLNAVTSMVDTMAGVVEAFVLTPQETVNIEAIQAVSALYQQKSNSERVPSELCPQPTLAWFRSFDWSQTACTPSVCSWEGVAAGGRLHRAGT